MQRFLQAYAELWRERLAAAAPEHKDMVRFGCRMVERDMEVLKGSEIRPPKEAPECHR